MNITVTSDSLAVHSQPRMSVFSRIGSAVRPHLPLMLILVLQAAVSLITLHNTAFQDEALYLYAGRQVFASWFGGPAVTATYATYFSGYPALYPALAGALDMVGGLELARFFSLLCMLGVTTCVAAITQKLFNRESAICAAAIFACQAPVLFLSRLATYDALCLLCLALALTMAICLNRAKLVQSFMGALAIGMLLVLATGVKYAGLLFVPSILVVFAIQTIQSEARWWRKLTYIGAALFSTLAGLEIGLRVLGQAGMAGLSFTTTNRVAFIRTPTSELLLEVLTLGGFALVLGFIGFLMQRGQRFLLMATLVGSALLAPAYHIYKGEAVSLNKHVAFAVFFIIPLAGFALSKLMGMAKLDKIPHRWPVGIALLLCIFSFGVQQAQQQYRVWANSTQVMTVLRTQVRPGAGRYLAEEFDASRYYLRDVTDPWQWESLDWFAYTNKAHQQLFGTQAYQAAIAEGYFDVVELNYGYHAGLDYAIDPGLKNSKMYQLVAKIPYTNLYGTGYYWVWVKVPQPSTSATGR